MFGSISGSLDQLKGSVVDFGGSVRDLIDIAFGSMQGLVGGGEGGEG